MSEWIPTNELRFVMRKETDLVSVDLDGNRYYSSETQRILQQGWVLYDDTDDTHTLEEWRDVPVMEQE